MTTVKTFFSSVSASVRQIGRDISYLPKKERDALALYAVASALLVVLLLHLYNMTRM